MTWMLDKSASMRGFQEGGSLEPLIRRLRAAADQALADGAPGREQLSSYFTVGKGVKPIDGDIRWILQKYNQTETALAEAIHRIHKDSPDLAFVVTDGLPSDPKLTRTACPGGAAPYLADLLTEMKGLMTPGRGLWLYALRPPFAGPYFMNCRLADAALRQEIDQQLHFGPVKGCDRPGEGECWFTYQGPRTLLVLVAASPPLFAAARGMVRALKGKGELAMQLWPAEEPGYAFTAQAAQRTPPGPGIDRIAAGPGRAQVECDSPDTMLGLELGLREEPFGLPGLLRAVARVEPIPLSEPADDAARADPALDIGQAAVWLRPPVYPPGFQPGWFSHCGSAFDALSGRGAWTATPAEKQACQPGRCARIAALCGCVQHTLYGRHKRALRMGLWARRGIEQQDAAVLSSLLAPFDLEKDAYRQPDKVQGLGTLIAQLGRAALQMGPGDIELQRLEVDVTIHNAAGH